MIGLNPERDCVLRPIYKKRRPTSGDKEVWALWTAGCFYGDGGCTDGWQTKAAVAQRQYEAEERAKQIERERIADEQWKAAEARRKAAKAEAERIATEEEARRIAEAAERQIAAARRQADRANRLHRVMAQSRQQAIRALISCACPSCEFTEYEIWLPAPHPANVGGHFEHKCPSCNLIYRLMSGRLKQECMEMHKLMGSLAA